MPCPREGSRKTLPYKNEIMEIVLAAVVLALAFVVLALPLYAGRSRVQLTGGSTTSELTAQRDGIYAMLRDLDQDYQLGKLDQADYHERREKYMARAADVLQEIDGLRQSPAGTSAQSDEIEREVAELRRSRNRPQAVEAAFCRNCGRPVEEGDRFCGKCGHELI